MNEIKYLQHCIQNENTINMLFGLKPYHIELFVRWINLTKRFHEPKASNPTARITQFSLTSRSCPTTSPPERAIRAEFKQISGRIQIR